MHDDMKAFLQRNQLTGDYLQSADRWFQPLIDDLLQRRAAVGAKKTLLVGVSGCQGSGKSTLADYLCEVLRLRYQLGTAHCSLDDFYLSRSERAQLAATVHPLLATRGVPGTHRTQYALETLNRIKQGEAADLPVFNKAIDDVSETGRALATGLDVFVFEGWCLGARPQTAEQLLDPVNELERNQDGDGAWRRYVNQQLAGDYATLFGILDCMVMLRAPSFNTVVGWRLEQEEKLAKRLRAQGEEKSATKLMSREQIERFVQYYQRITEQLLIDLPSSADHVYTLGEDRSIEAYNPNPGKHIAGQGSTGS